MNQLVNFGKARVNGYYNASQTSVTLFSGGAARLPPAPCYLAWWDASQYPDPADDPNREIVLMTAVVGDTLTVVRGQQGLPATTKNISPHTYLIFNPLTKADIQRPGILDFTDSPHTHQDALNGGVLTEAAFAGILPAAKGGTGNGFFKVLGPASPEKSFIFPDASATVLTSAVPVTVPQGGLGIASGVAGGVPYFVDPTHAASSPALPQNALLLGGGPGQPPQPLASLGTPGQVLISNGPGFPPVFAPPTAVTAHHATHETGGTDAIAALDAAVITGGVLADARLSSNVALRAGGNTFTATQAIYMANAVVQLKDTSNADVNQQLSQLYTNNGRVEVRLLDSGGSLQSLVAFNRSGAIIERNRATPMGEWVSVPFNAANFIPGAGTWTVNSGLVTYNKYTLIGRTLIWTIQLDGTTIGGSPNYQVSITIPGGLSAIGNGNGALSWWSTGGSAGSFAIAGNAYWGAGTVVNIARYDFTNLLVGTMSLRMTLAIEI